MGDSAINYNQLLEENKRLKQELAELQVLTFEKEQTEEALRNSEERFNVFFELAPDAIYLLDFEGNFIDVNKVVEETLGYDRDTLVGTNVFDKRLIEESDIPIVYEGFAANKNGLNYGPKTIVLYHRNGNRIYAEASSYPITLKGQKVILGIARDITDRKKSEQVLKENEQRFSLHINQTPLGVIEWDLDFKVKKWNPAAEKIFGYTAEEAIGRQASFIVDKEFSSQVDIIFSDLIALKGGRRSTNENVKRNGETINCEWYNTPLVNDEGQVIAVASLVQDITEQIRGELIQKVQYNISNAVNTSDNLNTLIALIQNELGQIIDTKNFYVALYDEKSDTMSLPFFIDENDTFSKIPIKKTLTGYVINSKRSLLATTEVMKELEDSGNIENIGTNCKIWMGVPLKIEGKVIGALAVQSYVDENAFGRSEMKILEFVSDQISISIHRKKAEEDLVNALQKAEESDRLKTSFLQNVSHEIRTPMNGIMGFTSLLKDPNLNSKEKNEYIRIIEKSGKRMLSTINDLMDISKIESGQVEIEVNEININKQLEELYTFFKPETENKGLILKTNMPLSDAEAVLISDREKIYAVLVNLIKNAIKYSAKGSVEFGYQRTEEGFEFFVKDTGIGIPSDLKESVFDRFVQVDQRLSSEYEGTGLGLSITRAYIEMLGGKIWLESEEGTGSVFRFNIPGNGIASKSKRPQKKEQSDNGPGVKNLKIVVAEDDETIRAYLKIAIRKMCKEILFTTNGLETVEVMRNNPDVDLVLMDVKMPEMDGYEATRQIREFNKEVIIFAQSAFAFDTEQEKVFAAGCNDFISKPIKRSELIEIIEKYFGN